MKVTHLGSWQHSPSNQLWNEEQADQPPPRKELERQIVPERDKREDEDARGEDISRPSEWNVDVPVRILNDRENWSSSVQLPDNPEVVTSVPALPKTEG